MTTSLVGSLGSRQPHCVVSSDAGSTWYLPASTGAGRDALAWREARVAATEGAKEAGRQEPARVEDVAREQDEDGEHVRDRRPEARRRRLGKIARRDRDLGVPEARGHDLRDDLLVEDEAVGVQDEVHALEHLAAKRAVSGVELREPEAERPVLERREEAVRDVLPPRHPLPERRARLEP